jgi:hypothetical protein
MMTLPECMYSIHELICEKTNGLEAERSVAEVKLVLEGGSQKIRDHFVIVELSSEPAY